jgi:hypothetical protein
MARDDVTGMGAAPVAVFKKYTGSKSALLTRSGLKEHYLS